MASYNKVILLGNVTRDIEVRYTPKGSAVCDFGIAVNHKYKSDSGEMMESVTFVDITLFGKVAEIAGKYLSKGNPVLVEGRLQTDSWEDKQTGQKRSKLKVVGENMQLLGGKREEGGGDSGGQSQARPATGQRQQARPQQQKREEPDYGSMPEDDIPF